LGFGVRPGLGGLVKPQRTVAIYTMMDLDFIEFTFYEVGWIEAKREARAASSSGLSLLVRFYPENLPCIQIA
jgi:hypothetical protein